MSHIKKNGGILVVSYECVRIEADLLQVALGEWYYVVLDEAQKIKNWKSQVYQACTGLRASHRLILSGTPM